MSDKPLVTVTEYRLAYSTGDGIGVMQILAPNGTRWFPMPNREGWDEAQKSVRKKYPGAVLLAMTPVADEETYSE